MTKFLSPFEKGAKPFWETTPAAGGGAAGAVLVVNPREEVKADRFRQGRGGGRPWRNSLDRLPRDVMDVAAADAEVDEFTVRQAAQLGDGVPVAAPVAVVADQVHGSTRFVFLRIIPFVYEQ